MIPSLSVISLCDSFRDVWPQLVGQTHADLEVREGVADFIPRNGTCAILVSAPGAESDAIPVIQQLHGSSDIAVVGTDTDYRRVASILQAGAGDYFAFPADLGLCRSWVIDQIQAATRRQKGAAFADDERKRFDFSRLIGESPRLRASLSKTARIIPYVNANVLITGETGTGKELLARAVHYNGSRASAPLVEINCTTLPENLLEAELFGYEPGAFTDARAAKPGLFEVAHGGTLFLDEIGDLSLPLQAKLLRVLEAKKIRRLGSIRETQIDVRIVAATNINLEAAVQEGTFRSDLYFRLSVIPISLPPLRDRGDDVLRLAEHFLQQFSREYDIVPPRLNSRVKEALRLHSWPGNVRELRNSIERAILLGDGEIYVEDLFPQDSASVLGSGVLPFPASMGVIERAAAKAAVERCAGNKSEASRLLGISRKHLYSLLKEEEAPA